jgi:hypothetical protein
MKEFAASMVKGAGFAVGGLLATALVLHLARRNGWQLPGAEPDSGPTFATLGFETGSQSSWGGC